MKGTITSAEVREATGLSQKTLTRWHKSGYIPTPEIGQHPGGRGKMGFYPRHTVALIRRVVSLKADGHPLKKAAAQAAHEFEQREEPGRPSAADPVTIEEICKGIKLGLPNKDAALRAGISEPTFYSWILKAKEPDAPPYLVDFLEAVDRAKADLKAILLARIHQASSAGQWQAATWILSRKFPTEFGQTVEAKVKHSGSIHTGPRKVTLELVRPDRKAETIVREGKEPYRGEAGSTTNERGEAGSTTNERGEAGSTTNEDE